MNPGSIPSRAKFFFLSFPKPPDRLSVLASLSNRYGRLFPGGKSNQGVKFTNHLYLLPRLSIRGDIRELPHISLWRGA
jgi:hypothetical protein